MKCLKHFTILGAMAFLAIGLVMAQGTIKFGDDGNSSGKSSAATTEETSGRNSGAADGSSSRQGKAILFGDSNGNPPPSSSPTASGVEDVDARINIGAPAFQNSFQQQQQQQFPPEYYNNFYQQQQQQQQQQAGQRRPGQKRPFYPAQPNAAANPNVDRTELYYPNGNGITEYEETEAGAGGLFGLGLFERFDVERSLVAPAVSGLVTAGVLLAAVTFLGPILGFGFSMKADSKSDVVGGEPGAAREGRSFKNAFRDRYPDWYNTIAEINPLEMSLKWMQIERDECRRRNICEFQNRATKLPIFGKLFRAIFQRFAPRYIDAVDAAERNDLSCDRLYTCSYGLRGLIDRIKGRLHSIFGKKNRV